MQKYLKNVLKAVKTKRGWPKEGEKITVSKTSQAAGAVYEKVRKAVEYEEEHLVRRSAIRRILVRRIDAIDEEGMTRAEALLREMVWAKYLPNKKVPVEMIETIDEIIAKYDNLFTEIEGTEKAKHNREWIFDVMATEIEYTLDSPRVDEALANFMFHKVKDNLVWQAEEVEESQRNMLVYTAIYRALLKSNTATLRYRVFTLYFPNWPNATKKEIKEVASRVAVVIDAVEEQITHPYADQLFRLMRRNAFVFLTIRDIIQESGGESESIFKDDDKLKRAVRKAAEKRYASYKIKRTRTVGRAVLFLLITKMVLAIAIEVPYEQFVIGEISKLPLAINILFHPLFLATIGVSINIPAKKNTDRLIELIKDIVREEESENKLGLVFKVKRPWTQGILGKFFTTIYILTYVLSYGIIAWILLRFIHFNIVSTTLFLFFFSLVAYFGIRIRQSLRELLVIERQGGFISTTIDFFLLPIVRVGRWMSMRAPKVNIFVFFLDFIVEAPFKLVVNLIEGWISFMREQKEEID